MQSTLDEFKMIMDLKMSDIMPEEYHMDLFHYTSPIGMQSILFGDSNQVTLWASRYDCLNDYSEGNLAEVIFQEVCLDLRERDEINEDLYKLFSTVRPARTILLHYHLGDEIKITRPECDRYICSFSKNKDSLAMWNYYSKVNKYDGFNVGVFPACIKASLEKYFCEAEATFNIHPVVYRQSEQKEMIEDLLIRLRDKYDKKYDTSIRYIISNKLTDWSLIFKNECFQHEEEVRIVVDVAKRENKIPIKYRVNAGYVVPYIELKLDKDAITYVNFGPLQCEDKMKKHQVDVMEEMLSRAGYTALVEYSNIPVRY